MSNNNKKKGFNIVRLLGLVLLPLMAGGALGAYMAFCLYSRFINDIDAAIVPEVEMEYGHPIMLESFFKKVPVNTTFITDINQIDTGKLATYEIFFDCGGHTVSSILKVVDKTAPTGTAVPVEMFCGKAPEPETLVKDVFDLTEVKIEYAEGTPNLVMNSGEMKIPVKLTDQNGNTTVIDVPFNVKDDYTPPVISGVKKFEHVAKDPDKITKAEYLDGVTATDDYTTVPKLEVDYSKVNLKAVGVYPIRYIASDKAGNRTEVESSVTVFATYNGGATANQKDIKKALEIGRKQLNRITKKSDTDVVKAMKIYYWVYHHIYFSTGASPYKGWAKAAINAINKKRGSCYGRACACKAMLDAAGIDNFLIMRKKIKGYRIHNWNLVKLNGEWYHCDVQIYLYGLAPRGFFCFMMTDKEIAKAPTNHSYKKSRFKNLKRATKSVQKWVDVYNGKIKKGFPYKKK